MISPDLRAYLECALWSSTTEDGEPLDREHGPEDFAPEAIAQAQRELAAFQEAAGADHQEAADLLARPGRYGGGESVAHDFWLTRTRCGAGFWDGDLPKDLGRRLTALAHAAGERWPYVGDDGLIYFA